MTTLTIVIAVIAGVLLLLVIGVGFCFFQRLRSQSRTPNLISKKEQEVTTEISNTKNELKQLTSTIKEYQKANRSLMENVNNLFSKGTKGTGELGETLAERLLSHAQAISKNEVKNKYLVISAKKKIKAIGTDNKYVIPDLTIESAGVRFPPVYLDIKFPKEVYQSYIKAGRATAEKKNLIKSLKKGIEDINKKYLDSISWTSDSKSGWNRFAIMFLPSDELFRDCLQMQGGFGKQADSFNSGDRSFIDFCFDKRIVPTSPANLIGILTTIERYCQLFKTIDDQESNLAKIQKWKSNYQNIRDCLGEIQHDLKKVADKLKNIDSQMKQGLKNANSLSTPEN